MKKTMILKALLLSCMIVSVLVYIGMYSWNDYSQSRRQYEQQVAAKADALVPYAFSLESAESTENPADRDFDLANGRKKYICLHGTNDERVYLPERYCADAGAVLDELQPGDAVEVLLDGNLAVWQKGLTQLRSYGDGESSAGGEPQWVLPLDYGVALGLSSGGEELLSHEDGLAAWEEKDMAAARQDVLMSLLRLPIMIAIVAVAMVLAFIQVRRRSKDAEEA